MKIKTSTEFIDPKGAVKEIETNQINDISALVYESLAECTKILNDKKLAYYVFVYDETKSRCVETLNHRGDEKAAKGLVGAIMGANQRFEAVLRNQ